VCELFHKNSYRFGTILESNGFILKQDELIPTAIESFEGIKVVIEAVLEDNGIPISKRKSGFTWIEDGCIVEIFLLATTELFIESGNVYTETKRNVDFYIAFLMHPCVVVGKSGLVSTNPYFPAKRPRRDA
jgi:hypothetical protein